MRFLICSLLILSLTHFVGCESTGVATSTLSPEVQQKVRQYNDLAADYIYGKMKHHTEYRKDVKSVVPIAHETFLKSASIQLNGVGYTSQLFRENADNPEFDYGLTITSAQTDKVVSKSKDGFWHESFIYSTIVVDGEHTFKTAHKTLITTDKETGEPELWSCVLQDIFLH